MERSEKVLQILHGACIALMILKCIMDCIYQNFCAVSSDVCALIWIWNYTRERWGD